MLKEGKKPTVRFFDSFCHLLPLPSYKYNKMAIVQLIQVSDISSALLIKVWGHCWVLHSSVWWIYSVYKATPII